jgi:hypothetical protein
MKRPAKLFVTCAAFALSACLSRNMVPFGLAGTDPEPTPLMTPAAATRPPEPPEPMAPEMTAAEWTTANVSAKDVARKAGAQQLEKPRKLVGFGPVVETIAVQAEHCYDLGFAWGAADGGGRFRSL